MNAKSQATQSGGTPSASRSAGKTPQALSSNSGVPTNLKSYVERMVALKTEQQSLAEDIKELKVEAKANDIDPKVLVAIVKREMEDAETAEKRRAFEEKFDAYAFAIGLLD